MMIDKELEELEGKIKKLDSFLWSAEFWALPIVEQSLLLDQSRVLCEYKSILERMAKRLSE